MVSHSSYFWISPAIKIDTPEIFLVLLRLFRTRDEVNQADPYALSVTATISEYDALNGTRIRAEGADYYAALLLDEAGSSYLSIDTTGSADPRIEPNDIVWVTLPDGTRKLIVDGIDYNISITDSEVNCDMEIIGRAPRSEV
jgi:hypothetical protein